VKKFVGREYRNPTISHLTNGRLLLMWTDGQSILNSQSSDYGASWSAPARLEQGVDLQVVIGAESSSLLENGMKEAGYHSTTWNASDVASGVYFARFTTTDAGGNVRLSKVSKLLLTK
jgi:hypothetical protein